MIIVTVVLALLAESPTSQQSGEAELRHIISLLQAQLSSVRQYNEEFAAQNRELKKQLAADDKTIAQLRASTRPSATNGASVKIDKTMSLEQITDAMGGPSSTQTFDDGRVLCCWTVYKIAPQNSTPQVTSLDGYANQVLAGSSGGSVRVKVREVIAIFKDDKMISLTDKKYEQN